MNLQKLLLTKNACYKAGKKIKPKGIMVHSTGANNPKLSRYVGPNDGKLGENKYGNHWNQDKPGGREVCVHAFIGKLADGSVATYQTLPWDYRGWHSGGSANDTHIGFEICEDGLADRAYFSKVYREAVELCAYLCKLYKLTEKDILCHSEGNDKGIASNHSDVMHWFPKHGKSMDTLRADVKALLATKPAASKTVEMDGINAERVTDALILYVGKASTGTNKWGVEAVINSSLKVEKINAYGVGNTAIPAGKMVLSGHGKKATWMLDNLKAGQQLSLTLKV